MIVITTNIEQNEAINATHDKIVCLAGAGSGKTYTLVSRIHKLVKDGISPHKILVLTFTRAAGNEMRSRYIKMANTSSRLCPEFRTFHGFCYSLLVKDSCIREKLGYSTIPDIASEANMKSIMRTARLQCGLRQGFENNKKLSKHSEFQLQAYRKAIRRNLRVANLISFDVLCEDISRLFKEHDMVIHKYIATYEYLFVDEFQDTDPIQFEFIQSFTTSKIFVVGDICQSIYSFRSATSDIMKSLIDDPNWKTITLHTNYRSDSNICDTANHYTKYAEERYRILLKPKDDAPAGDVQIIPYHTELDWDESIHLKHLSKICSILNTWEGNTAILCRSNNEVNNVVDYLQTHDILVNTSNSVDSVIEVLKCSIDQEYYLDWLCAQLPSDEYSHFVRLVYIQPEIDKIRTAESVATNKQLLHYIDIIHSISNMIDQDIDTSVIGNDIISLISPICKLKCNNIDFTCSSDNKEIIYKIIQAYKSPVNSSVYVGTIHSVKGLEYDNVIIINVNDRPFKLNSEDNNNLFYVGITRAKHNLTIFIYQ